MGGKLRATTLEQIAENSPHSFVDGPFGSDLPASLYTTAGIPLIRGSNLSLGKCRFKADEFVYVSEATAERIQRSSCKPNDIIFTKKGTLGQTGIIPERQAHSRYLISGNQMKLTVDRSKADPLFVYYFVSSPQSRSKIIKDSEATGVPKTNLQYLRSFTILLPPLAKQKEIAAILGSLDDKIELNRRMNATLESMARALFQSWFVDFDPVRAKLDGRKPAGMDAATAALFPSEFQDSELGRIPKGWRVCKLGDIAENASITFDFKRSPEVIFVNTGDVLEGDFLHSKRSPHIGLPGQAKKSIRPNDIVFSEIRPANKRYAFVDFDSNHYVVSTKFMIIRGSKEIHPRMLYRILTAKETVDEFQLQAESRSGTFPQITFDSICHLPIMLPPIEIQESFQREVGKMDAQIKVNKEQSRSLATLRDLLLPRLLSGELIVKQPDN
ncbi:MAG: restriction modification system specificity domain protein [Verrucomicrobiales bacterium]|nr:restriction modification system specificity domain protein [Verrucomicrobiales bacterium]